MGTGVEFKIGERVMTTMETQYLKALAYCEVIRFSLDGADYFLVKPEKEEDLTERGKTIHRNHGCVPIQKSQMVHAPSDPTVLPTSDSTEGIKTDPIVEAVVEKFRSRSQAGIAKYGTTLDRKDLTLADWLNHLHEELMDAVLYIERVKIETGIEHEKDFTFKAGDTVLINYPELDNHGRVCVVKEHDPNLGGYVLHRNGMFVGVFAKEHLIKVRG